MYFRVSFHTQNRDAMGHFYRIRSWCRIVELSVSGEDTENYRGGRCNGQFRDLSLRGLSIPILITLGLIIQATFEIKYDSDPY